MLDDELDARQAALQAEGLDIYTAVLEHDVRTPEEFANHLASD